jgi:hypothetical protein
MTRIFLILALVLLPRIAQAQIAFDAASISTLFASVSSCVVSHTVSGSNRILFAAVLNATGDLIDEAEYNGVAMTLIDKVSVETNIWNYLWYLVAPDTGTHDVVFANSGAATLTTICAASSYTGADQSSPIEADTTNTASGSPVTSITTGLTNAADAWTILFSRNDAGAQSAGAGSTQRVEDDTYSVGLYDSNAALSAGSNSMTVNFSSSPTVAATVMASFCPAAGCSGGGGSSPHKRRKLMGVGLRH